MTAPALLTAVLMGLCLGSYAATFAVRYACAESAAGGRSRCDHCRAPLRFAETLPVVSFLHLRGACRRCGGRIDPLHFAGETMGALILVSAMVAGDGGRALLLAALGLVLLAAALCDIGALRLPDRLTASVAALCTGLALQASPETLWANALMAGGAFVLLEGLRRGYAMATGRAGLGFGDVKLIAALTLWLGAATPWMVTLSAAAGLLVALRLQDRSAILPFGPCIAGAAWVVGILTETWPWAI